MLFRAKTPMSASELTAAVRAQSNQLYRSTVYRDVDELVNLGVIAPVLVANGPTRYRLAATNRSRFVCSKCGATSQVPDELLRALARSAQASTGFAIDSHDVTIGGRCTRCR
jgi:Fe2+ or Zn2+ uptake regulation protein